MVGLLVDSHGCKGGHEDKNESPQRIGNQKNSLADIDLCQTIVIILSLKRILKED